MKKLIMVAVILFAVAAQADDRLHVDIQNVSLGVPNGRLEVSIPINTDLGIENIRTGHWTPAPHLLGPQPLTPSFNGFVDAQIYNELTR